LAWPGPASAFLPRGALRSGGLASAALLLLQQTHREQRPPSEEISGERQFAATVDGGIRNHLGLLLWPGPAPLRLRLPVT